MNAQLEALGYGMGTRLADDFCARQRGAGAARCRTFRETMETVAGPALRMFLGVTAALEGWNAEGTAVSLRLADNPLADFVELPPAYSELRYSNVLCGALRGALEMVSVRVDARFVRDVLNGDDATEIRVTLKEVLADTAGQEYQDE